MQPVPAMHSPAVWLSLSQGMRLPDAARFASGVAALATTALGAQTALPLRRDLQTFLVTATAQ